MRGLALLPFSLCAVVAWSAFAEETLLAQWLVNGARGLGELLALAEGELLLEDMKAIAGR